jgi:DprA winged helix domain
MISRQESRDRRAVLAALTASGPSAVTLLGLYSLTALPEARVQAALSYLEVHGIVHRVHGSSGLPGPQRTLYRVRT